MRIGSRKRECAQEPSAGQKFPKVASPPSPEPTGPSLWRDSDDWRTQLAALLKFQDECAMRMRAAGPMLSEFMAADVEVSMTLEDGSRIVLYPVRTQTAEIIFFGSRTRSGKPRPWDPKFKPAAAPCGPLSTAVYMLFAAPDELLYVGITGDLQGRMSSHARDKSWWSDVTRREVAWYPTRQDAEAVERLCIDAYNPKHNIVRPCVRDSDQSLRNRMPSISGVQS